MKSGVSLSCSERQDLEMTLIGWHTQVASRSRPEKGPRPFEL
jgi:hypothetical protein